ncbi:MarR family winged helix-turn-helix transcriptional regulator [Paraburkholderia lacunae]|uniref:MarR family transcriptional regulator n=1 Tax=Paraburkholderia lacunae TaxID=2211104 RepID=A0A370N0G6_9BURK|nr:MarR family winged helix-turn-helix transcriptional regulator [Paraburkholderia lacunae]RDJ99096.1 MarR family transcriptional regulator [Paraburkholderia lacunae]
MHTQFLQNDDCFAVRQAARRISQFYERYLSATGVTPSQYSILSVLARNPGLTMARLSAVLVVERTTLLRTLKPLLKSDLVAGRYQENGKRRLVFDLTEYGMGKLAEASVSWQAAQEAFELRFGSERAAQLRAELFRIKADIAAT